MVKVFEFQDYREYLKAYYEDQKATTKSFSYRLFSKKANINTSSFLYHVIQGKKNLTKNSIINVSGAIGHTREESEYFENLVFFNQAKTIVEKTHYYSKLIEIKRPINIESIEKSKYEFYKEWYHSVLREAVSFFKFNEDYTALGKFLIPQISEKDAKNSVQLLEKLEFIKRDEHGVYKQTNNLINAKPNPIEALIAQKHQIKMAELGIKAYDSTAIHERLSTSTTFSISEQTYRLILLKAREFRRDVMELAKIDNDPERVYQMNINLFPVSRSVKNAI